MNRQDINPAMAGKVIVLTGASSGFGKGTAVELAKAGHHLVLAARQGDLLEQLACACRGAGGTATPVVTDVSDQTQVQRLTQHAIGLHGRIDAWINDAGVGAIGNFEQIPAVHHEQVIQTNLCGTIFGSHAALTQFIRQGHGTLINLSSVLGKIPAPYYSSYVAAKFGVAGLGTALRLELEARRIENIHICTVFPMAADTPFFDHAANYTGKEAQPIGPLYDPHEVINVLVDLLEHPRDEVVIGRQGKLMNFLHQLAPDMVESMMRRTTHQTQMEEAPVGMRTDGSVQSPITQGRGVDGGRQSPSEGAPRHHR